MLLGFITLVGKQVKPPHKATAIWTHPREDTGPARILRCRAISLPIRVLSLIGLARSGRDAHPLGIERLSHMTVIVGDLAKAKSSIVRFWTRS